MGFLTDIVSATVKTVLTPIAIVKDAVNVATDENPKATKKLLDSAAADIEKAKDNLCDGEVL
jgi:hypothetical protein